MAQVVEPARQIVRAAGLRDVTGGFAFESCNGVCRNMTDHRYDGKTVAPPSLISCARNGMLERRPTLADHLVDQIIYGPFRLGQNITQRHAGSEWKAISASSLLLTFGAGPHVCLGVPVPGWRRRWR
jgi:hypothetical protein